MRQHKWLSLLFKEFSVVLRPLYQFVFQLQRKSTCVWFLALILLFAQLFVEWGRTRLSTTILCTSGPRWAISWLILLWLFVFHLWHIRVHFFQIRWFNYFEQLHFYSAKYFHSLYLAGRFTVREWRHVWWCEFQCWRIVPVNQVGELEDLLALIIFNGAVIRTLIRRGRRNFQELEGILNHVMARISLAQYKLGYSDLKQNLQHGPFVFSSHFLFVFLFPKDIFEVT